MLLASWWLASWKGGKEAVPGSSCSGLPCGPVGQVQGHKQVATHMRGSSHIIKALTPVSPASQGAEAIVQSPGWGLLAQWLWARAWLCRPPFPQLEGEGLGWSGRMRPVTPSGSPESSCQDRPLEQSQEDLCPAPTHLERKPLRAGSKNSAARQDVRQTAQREGQRGQDPTHGHTA